MIKCILSVLFLFLIGCGDTDYPGCEDQEIAEVDSLCQECTGGATGITPNSTCLDCAGTPNGFAVTNCAGECGAAPTASNGMCNPDFACLSQFQYNSNAIILPNGIDENGYIFFNCDDGDCITFPDNQ